MFHSILVALDGSPHADRALTEAIDLAESEHARLTLLTSIQPPPALAYYGSAGAYVKNVIEGAEAEAKAILASGRDRVPDDVSVTTVLSKEPAQSALMGQVDAGGHDLVVMGSRGRGALSSVL